MDFGEKVMYMPIVHGRKLNKLETKWSFGRFCGVRPRSNEKLTMATEGIQKAKNVRRLGRRTDGKIYEDFHGPTRRFANGCPARSQFRYPTHHYHHNKKRHGLQPNPDEFTLLAKLWRITAIHLDAVGARRYWLGTRPPLVGTTRKVL